MKLKGAMSILIDDERTTITIEDISSSINFVEIELTNKQLVQMLSRLAMVEVDLNIRGLDKVGKTMETDRLTFEMPEHDYTNIKQIAIETAKKFCPKGWEPEKYFGSQGSFTTKNNKVFANCIIRRWV